MTDKHTDTLQVARSIESLSKNEASPETLLNAMNQTYDILTVRNPSTLPPTVVPLDLHVINEEMHDSEWRNKEFNDLLY